MRSKYSFQREMDSGPSCTRGAFILAGKERLVVRKALENEWESLVALMSLAVGSVDCSIYGELQKSVWLSGNPWFGRKACNRGLLTLLAETVSGESAKKRGVAAFHSNHLLALYVDPECHGVGVGSLLLKSVEEHIFRSGQSTIYVNASVNASCFYVLNGFRKIKGIERHFIDASTGDVAILNSIYMTKELCFT